MKALSALFPQTKKRKRHWRLLLGFVLMLPFLFVITFNITRIFATEFGADAYGDGLYGGIAESVFSARLGREPTTDPGLVAHWQFDDNTGQTVEDSTSNFNTGTLGADSSSGSDDPSWTAGKYGSALRFLGDDYVSIPDHTSLDLTSAITISSWVNFDSLSAFHTLVGKRDVSANVSNYTFRTSSTGTELQFFFNANGSWQIYTTTNASLTTGQWYHLAATYDGSSVKIYKNGTLLSGSCTTGTCNLSMVANNNSLSLGRDGENPMNYLVGKMDDVRIYNYARTQGGIIEDMNAGHPIGGSPVGSQYSYWALDEQQGQTLNNRITTAPNGTMGLSTGDTNNDPTWKTATHCKINGCLEFDGSDDYAHMGTAIDLGATPTLSAWVYLDSNNVSSYIRPAVAKGNYGGDGNGDMAIQLAPQAGGMTGAGMWQFYIRTSTGTARINTNVVADTGVWQHLVGTWNGTTAKFYIDGKLVGSAGLSGSFDNTSTKQMLIGAYPTTFTWGGITTYKTDTVLDGRVDEVKIYHTALTQEEVLVDMNANSAVNAGTGHLEADQLTDGAGDPPIAHWKFDENTGTTSVVDSSGNNYTATMTSFESTDWIPGKYGSGLTFDGSEYLAAHAAAPSLAGDNTFTISFWAKDSQYSNTRAAIGLSTSGDANKSLIIYPIDTDLGNGPRVWYNGASFINVNNSTGLDDNQWHHFVFVSRSATDHELFVDGKSIAKSSVSKTLDAGLNWLFLGAWQAGTQTMIGGLDDIKLWNYSLDSSQIAYEYNRGLPYAHWKMDECSGTTINDSSGSNEAGTLSIGGSGSQSAAGNCSTTGSAWGNGASGKHNTSIYLDGTDDYIALPDDLVDSDSIGSLCTWYYYDKPTDDGTQGTLFAFSDNASVNYKHSFYISDNGTDSGMIRVVLRVAGSGNQIDYYTDNDVVTRQTWQHVCFVQDGTGVDLYLNGQEVPMTAVPSGGGNTSTWFSNIASQAEYATIGNIRDNAPDSYFTGKIDDFRLFNYPLSIQQVRQIMNGNASLRFGPAEGSP
jgi:hypothetical protein